MEQRVIIICMTDPNKRVVNPEVQPDDRLDLTLRPKNLAGMIGQERVRENLEILIAAAKQRGEPIDHVLFYGPPGLGKTTLAHILANEMGVNIKVSAGPAIERQGDLAAILTNLRAGDILFIDEVHRLTKEAFDALLKTLEEPPSHVIFIFATTDPQALPPTILSRTQRYDFKRIPVSALAEAINSIAQKEDLTIDPDAALMIAKKADGSLRDAISLLDQLSSFSDSKIDIAGTAEVLGIVKTEFLSDITGALIAHDTSRALSLFGDFIKSGGDSQELAEALTGYIRTLLLVKNGVEDITILELEKNEIERAKEILDDIESVDLLRFFTILADYKQMIKAGQDPRFSFEAALVRLSSMDRAVTLEALLKNHDTGTGHINSPSTFSGSMEKSRNKNNNMRSSKFGYNNSSVPFPKADRNVDRKNNIEPLSYQGGLKFEIVSENWDNFCRFVSQEDKAIFAHLSLSMPSRLEDYILTIGVDDSHKFQFEQLNKIGNKKSLEKYLKKYFSQEVKLNIIQGPNEGRNSGDLPGNFNPEKLFNGSPGAKKLFDLMDGEILTQ